MEAPFSQGFDATRLAAAFASPVRPDATPSSPVAILPSALPAVNRVAACGAHAAAAGRPPVPQVATSLSLHLAT